MPSYSSPRARYCTRVVDELSHLAYTALLRRLVIFQQSAKSLVPRLKAKKTPGTFFKMTLNVDTEGNCSNDDAVCGRRLPHSFLGIHSTTLVYSRHCLENRCIDADNSDTVMEVYYSFMLWGVGREGSEVSRPRREVGLVSALLFSASFDFNNPTACLSLPRHIEQEYTLNHLLQRTVGEYLVCEATAQGTIAVLKQ